MPNRILRDGILTSARVARLGWAEEVFYRRLMSVVDDFGRYYGDPGMLRAACYPRQLNKVSDSDVGKWLTVLVEAALVRVYPAQDGERYLELLDFRQQVRAKESKFPGMSSTCIADATQTPANARLDVFVDVDVDECVSRGERATPAPSKGRKAKTAIPADFGVSERVKAWAAEKGFGQLTEHLDAFRRKVAANGYTYADWDAAFMEAVREDWAKLRGRGATPGQAPPPDAGAALSVILSADYIAQQAKHAAEAQSPEAIAARQQAMAKLGRLNITPGAKTA